MTFEIHALIFEMLFSKLFSKVNVLWILPILRCDVLENFSAVSIYISRLVSAKWCSRNSSRLYSIKVQQKFEICITCNSSFFSLSLSRMNRVFHGSPVIEIKFTFCFTSSYSHNEIFQIIHYPSIYALRAI